MAKNPVQRCTPEEVLAGLSPERLELAAHLPSLVYQLLPDVEQAGCPGWRLTGYRQRRYFVSLRPRVGLLDSGLEHGVAIPDPAGMLSGSARQVRYVRLASEVELDPAQPAPADLIQVAAARAGWTKVLPNTS